MNITMKIYIRRLLIVLLATVLAMSTYASESMSPFKEAESPGVLAFRHDRLVVLHIDQDVESPITIPRLAAPIRGIQWTAVPNPEQIQIKPGIDTWQISWKERPKGTPGMQIVFDAEPLLISEVKPIVPTGDGSFYLPAHLAVTQGEKVRYEPQPYKNTVGFWVGKEDSARWTIQVEKPGRYNVAVLQGCGKGQGGSTAWLWCQRPGEKIEDAKLKFEVLETGHWQNFKWKQLGEIELAHPGQVRVAVMPDQIKKNALMDIRAIHLIRLPEKN